MASGRFNLSDNNANQWAWVTYSESAPSIANNDSSLTVNVYFRRSNNGYTSYGTMSTSVAVDGVTKAESKSFSNNGTADSLVFSQTFTNIKHNANGSKSVSISVTATGNNGFSGSGSNNIDLDTIPRQATLTAAPHFTDEESPTITYSNPAGNAVSSLQACIASTDGKTIYVPYRDISKTDSSYTFNLTEAERAALRWATINSNTLAVKFYVTTVIGNNTYYSTLDKILTHSMQCSSTGFQKENK